jgi:hypothetical protein
MELNNDMKARDELPEDRRPAVVWRGRPRMWERCSFCDLRKECTAAGVVRGSKTCADARYSRSMTRAR